MDIENPMIRREPQETRDYEMWCSNPRCSQYGILKVRSGWWEPDTGWGEPDDLECHECSMDLQGWEPEGYE